MKIKVLPFVVAAIASIQCFSSNAQDKIVTYTLSVNNVRAFSNTGGLLFNNFGLSEPGFEAPKMPLGSGPRPSAIYASSLWMGGIDVNKDIRVAAQTYRQIGNDFQPGPMDPITGMPNTDTIFNDMWRINKADLAALASGTVTKGVRNWPAFFTTPSGTHPLAPFTDLNGDGMMDVAIGEHPAFPGDEALFFVYNDQLSHSETGSTALGVEVKGFVYAFETGDKEFLNNTVFVDYYLTNFTKDKYTDFVASVWTDFDLGNYQDDRIGVDTARNLYYAYNGKDNDDGVLGYGNRPPAIGVMYINQPLTGVIGYSNDNTPTGNPYNGESHYNYMNSRWKDGTAMGDSGTGYNAGKPTKFIFNGDPCKNTGWTEGLAGIAAGDRRILGNTVLGDFNPGQVYKISLAYIWSQDQNGGAINSLCKLMSQSDSLKNWLDGRPVLSAHQAANTAQVKIYPNPTTDKIFIETIDGDATAGLYDLAGRQVATAQNNTINAAGLAKGLYIVRGNVGNNYFSQKILVQ
jgi:hypothetical protein